MNPSLDVDAVLARLDRSSSNSLLLSIAKEIVQLNQMYASLLARVMAMESLQSTIDRIVDLELDLKSEELPETIFMDATYSLSKFGGFYELEYDQNGNPYRWTGPEAQFFSSSS